MDKRARAYIDTVKGKLLLLKKEWKEISPDNCFSTYTEQFSVLVHRNKDVVNKYLEARELAEKDPFSEMIYSKPAHRVEKRIMVLFKVFWVLSLIAAVALITWPVCKLL
jgi:hypothetical protein